jgi:hypothetical protein
LDVLIEQLSRLKKSPDAGLAGEALSDERLDALIEHYESQIRAARAANAAMPYKPTPSSFTGMIFDLVA